MKPSAKNITQLQEDEVFVFGSNREGRHGAGAALMAYQRFGAVYGKGIGMAGNTYAIPTRYFWKNESNNWEIKTFPLIDIAVTIDMFLKFASCHKDLNFLITEIGCGHAGYTPYEIAPFFIHAKDMINIFLPESFIEVLKNECKIK